jgi:hypothetical protein
VLRGIHVKIRHYSRQRIRLAHRICCFCVLTKKQWQSETGSKAATEEVVLVMLGASSLPVTERFTDLVNLLILVRF